VRVRISAEIRLFGFQLRQKFLSFYVDPAPTPQLTAPKCSATGVWVMFDSGVHYYIEDEVQRRRVRQAVYDKIGSAFSSAG